MFFCCVGIIIVGIGNEDFGLMDELDSDDKALKKEDGTEMERDIVQFVRCSFKFNHLNFENHMLLTSRWYRDDTSCPHRQGSPIDQGPPPSAGPPH